MDSQPWGCDHLRYKWGWRKFLTVNLLFYAGNVTYRIF